jgi:hypothetical protein
MKKIAKRRVSQFLLFSKNCWDDQIKENEMGMQHVVSCEI